MFLPCEMTRVLTAFHAAALTASGSSRHSWQYAICAATGPMGKEVINCGCLIHNTQAGERCQ